MKRIKTIIRIIELLIGLGCLGFLLFELIEFVLAPFYNGGHLPTMTYFGCGINLIVITYLLSLENSIRDC